MYKDSLLELLSAKSNYISCLLRVMGVSENDIEDLRNDVFEDAVKSIGTLRDQNSIDAWLRTIVMRRASKYFKKRGDHKEISNIMKAHAGEEVDVYDYVADEKTTESLFQEAERRREAVKLLDTLPETGKRIIQMRFWGDYKFSEIAIIMNINENTVKTVYRRSLRKLRNNYYEILGGEDVYG
ncbi:MAG: sigma-70 family RNA polymerase sigma factor [Bacillota bacterium]|nr:sigma-70 family RNA polymerase sigma factor [Bacillota bacterium]